MNTKKKPMPAQAAIEPASKDSTEHISMKLFRRSLVLRAEKERDTRGLTLTPEQATEIVNSWTMDLFNTDETIGDFLLLLRVLAYEPEPSVRENIFIAIESLLMPYTTGACEALDHLIEERFKVFKESC